MVSAGYIPPAVSVAGYSNPTGLGLTQGFEKVGSSAGSGFGAMGVGMGISAVGSMVSGIFGYMTQKVQMESQARMAKGQLAHQDTMARLDKKMSMKALAVENQKIDIQVDGQPKFFAAEQELKKAQGQLATIKAERRETKLTEKATALNTKALDAIFKRGGYDYGKAKALAS